MLLAAALAAANLPFLLARPKALGWRLLILVLMYFVVLGLARALEAAGGAVYPQGWEFYAATVFLFLVLAYPGFVWRYLWKKRN